MASAKVLGSGGGGGGKHGNCFGSFRGFFDGHGHDILLTKS